MTTGQFNKGNIRAAKLSVAQVMEMRQWYNEGWSQARLARHFQISVNQVGRIVRGEAWQDAGQIGVPPRGRWEAPDSPASAERLAEASHVSEMKFRKLLEESSTAETPPHEPQENPFEEQEAQAERLMEQLIGKRGAER